MNKKTYETPETSVMKVDSTDILAGSIDIDVFKEEVSGYDIATSVDEDGDPVAEELWGTQW